MQVSLVIPARDEAGGIEQTVRGACEVAAANGIELEVLVVDDGSVDATAALAERATARVLSHPYSGGYGRSLKTGIRAARHELVAIADADGTYPIAALPALLALTARFDMAVGRRTGRQYWRRLFFSPLRMLFLLLTSFVTGRWVPDPNSGLRVFRRDDVVPLLDRLPNGFSFTTTLTIIYMLRGKFVAFHPIGYEERLGRSKVRLVRDALRAAQGLVEVILEYNPLKLFLLMAAVPALAAVAAPLLAPTRESAFVAVVVLGATMLVVLAVGMLAAAGKWRR